MWGVFTKTPLWRWSSVSKPLCSHDRLVGEDGLLEFKAPLPHAQIEY
jgi:hypothetical protein